jgi:hypothetical protein
VHDFMDGKGIRTLSLDVLKAPEVSFEIRRRSRDGQLDPPIC